MRELLLITASAYVLAHVGLSAVSFPTETSRWIRVVRDQNRCQFPGKHRCKGKLQVHHIYPCAAAMQDESTRHCIDDPLNGITVCSNAHENHLHTGSNFVGPVCLDTRWDQRMKEIIIERTQAAMKRNQFAPQRKIEG